MSGAAWWSPRSERVADRGAGGQGRPGRREMRVPRLGYTPGRCPDIGGKSGPLPWRNGSASCCAGAGGRGPSHRPRRRGRLLQRPWPAGDVACWGSGSSCLAVGALRAGPTAGLLDLSQPGRQTPLCPAQCSGSTPTGSAGGAILGSDLSAGVIGRARGASCGGARRRRVHPGHALGGSARRGATLCPRLARPAAGGTGHRLQDAL